MNMVLVSEGTRYELSNDKSKIRSFHGHSVPGIIYQDELTESIPLYHGTSRDTLEEIKRVGAILPMSRVQVHLSKDMNKAKEVGGRHGSPVIIVIDTEKMLKDNLKIYSSGDGVYLTDSVPVEYFKEILNKHFETEIN
jgi:putative RNA 2'-phosphotransferase